jgi:hypothetical protein
MVRVLQLQKNHSSNEILQCIFGISTWFRHFETGSGQPTKNSSGTATGGKHGQVHRQHDCKCNARFDSIDGMVQDKPGFQEKSGSKK